MRWRFGGHFEPVLTTCALDWLECPFALADYIWSEVVTDVAECLANESILWRFLKILALLLICTTVVHLIYWQVRWTKEIQRNNQNLKQVGYKVQDLELKLNILTYKAQYGTWPLPNLSKTSAKTDSQTTQISRSQFGKENSWIKNLLTRYCDLLGRLEKSRYFQTSFRLRTTDLTFRKRNTKEINNVNSTGYQTYMDTEISQSEAEFSDNVSTDVSILSSSLAPTWKDQIVTSSPSEVEIQSDTRETLYEVKRRLENLHFSLKSYTLRDWTVAAHTNSYQGRGNNGRGYNDLISRKRKNNCNTSIDLRKSIKKHNVSDLIAMYAAYNAMILDRDKPRQFASRPPNDEQSSISNAMKCNRDKNNVSKKDGEFNISKELSEYKNSVNKSILHSNVTTGAKTMEMHKGDGDSEYFSERSASSKNNDEISVVSEKSSVDETSKESDSDDRSTSALLEEALRIKRDLLLRIELRKKFELEVQESNADKKTDECTYWERIENQFEPKMLDMISEETSDSSSTNRESKINVYKTLEKCANAQEVKINVCNKDRLEEDKSKFSENEITIADDVSINLLNGKSQNLSMAIEENVQENSNSVFQTEPVSKDDENQNIETLNLVSELNSSKLTESSSDTSVNRLIDRLIESERRSKSARSSSDSKSKKNLSMDSINSLIDNRDSIERAQSENEESNDCPRMPSTEADDVDNLAAVQSLPSEDAENRNILGEAMLKKADDKKNGIDEKKTNTIVEVNTQNSEAECANNLESKDNKICSSSVDEKACVELLMFENDEFLRKQVPVDELINVKSLIEEVSEKNTIESIEKKSLSLADNNPTVVQVSNSTLYTPLQNAEHSVTKIQKNINSITHQKQSPKNVNDFRSYRHIRTKSNLNLSSTEKQSFSPMFRRSRSYDTPREISNNKSNPEGEAPSDSFTSSSKSSSISHTPREHKYNDEDNAELDETKKSPFESLDVSSKSSLKSYFEIMTVEDDSIPEIKRDDSYKSLSSRSSKSQIMASLREITENRNSKADVERKSSLESLILSSKSSFKSCIPILKNRLESTKKNISESRSSLIQEPLANTLDSYRIDNEKLNTELQNFNNSKQETTVYVNVTNENDEITSKVLNPEQFFEYIKNKEIELKNDMNEEKINTSIMDNNHIMILSDSKMSTLIPSSSGNIDSTDVSSLGSSSCQLHNDQPQAWPCKIDSKETEVLVKHSTLDISTSITDIHNTFFTVENNEINELKIFEIPEEITKEDYITFLQMMNENPVLSQLPNVEESSTDLLIEIVSSTYLHLNTLTIHKFNACYYRVNDNCRFATGIHNNRVNFAFDYYRTVLAAEHVDNIVHLGVLNYDVFVSFVIFLDKNMTQ
ncbi:hypothetical protein TSAR_013290 [Trichomalopsis sarcophagae]|uniref:Uncharacterized protein n=1 Tax=Trichomalopsis sarcophagae TaxID=543379 RepID=A0A232EIF7_9HYME|nr:hypothetical protein TSAR_013290 [Trichomalopsis sarcophagae]